MSSQTDAIEAALKAQIEKAAKMLVLELDKNLRKATPVDTGHARASWIPSVGSPAIDVPDGASSALHDAGVAAVLSFTLSQGALYEATNVPYMPFLNLGSSSQAPAAFIEVAVEQAQAKVNAKFAGKIVVDATSGMAAQGAENLAEAYAPEGLP